MTQSRGKRQPECFPPGNGNFDRRVPWEEMLPWIPLLGHLFAILGDLDLAGLEHGLFCFR